MTWLYCGNQIKLWRRRAGVSREQLGKEAAYEYETVRSMETGRRRPTVRLLQVADQMCGADGLLTAAQAYLVPEKFLSYAQDYMQTVGLPPVVHSPGAFARRRLTGKMPPEPTVAAVTPRRVMECTGCGRRGRPEALPGGLCRDCRGRSAPDEALPPPDIRSRVAELRAANRRLVGVRRSC